MGRGPDGKTRRQRRGEAPLPDVGTEDSVVSRPVIGSEPGPDAATHSQATADATEESPRETVDRLDRFYARVGNIGILLQVVAVLAFCIGWLAQHWSVRDAAAVGLVSAVVGALAIAATMYVFDAWSYNWPFAVGVSLTYGSVLYGLITAAAFGTWWPGAIVLGVSLATGMTIQMKTYKEE